MHHLLKSIFLSIVLCCAFHAKSQSDSLYLEFKDESLHDTVRLKSISKFIRTNLWTKPDSCIIWAKEMNTFAKKADKPSFQGDSYGHMGYVYYIKSQFPEAVESFLEASKIFEDLEDRDNQSKMYLNLGSMYRAVGDIDNAITYANLSLEFAQGQPSEKVVTASAYNNLGLCYKDRDQFDSSDYYYEKSLALKIELGQWRGIANTLTNIGINKEIEDDYASAIDYLQKAVDTFEIHDDTRAYAETKGYLGRNYAHMGNNNKAKVICEDGYKTSLELENVTGLRVNCQCLAEAYEGLGNYKKALYFHKEFIRYKDSTNNDELDRDIIQKEFEFKAKNKALVDSIQASVIEQQHQLEVQQEQERAKSKERLNYFLFAGIGLVTILLLFIANRLKISSRQKKIIELQKSEVESQKVEIENQHMMLEETHKEITDSIAYAKRIQEAILPSESQFKSELPDSFVFYAPKDVVAGDFYWLNKTGDLLLFAVADCTGHGVPGAMVSVVCNNALDRAVGEFGLTEPAEILNKTRELVIASFEDRDSEVRDGMDIALCAFNPKTNKLTYSGANNSLYIIQNDEMNVFKANRQPIGKYEDAQPFDQHELQINKGDMLYIFTDGFADQFGGEKGKKMKYKSFKDLIYLHKNASMTEQHKHLKEAFEKWKGDFEQVDDVCLIGVKF